MIYVNANAKMSSVYSWVGNFISFHFADSSVDDAVCIKYGQYLFEN